MEARARPVLTCVLSVVCVTSCRMTPGDVVVHFHDGIVFGDEEKQHELAVYLVEPAREYFIETVRLRRTHKPGQYPFPRPSLLERIKGEAQLETRVKSERITGATAVVEHSSRYRHGDFVRWCRLVRVDGQWLIEQKCEREPENPENWESVEAFYKRALHGMKARLLKESSKSSSLEPKPDEQ